MVFDFDALVSTYKSMGACDTNSII